MGDTIYSDTEVPGYTLADVALTVAQKWAAYKSEPGDEAVVRRRAARPPTTPTGTTTSSSTTSRREENTFPYSNDGVDQGVNKINGEKLYKRGVRAFRDYNPVTYSKKTGIYRLERWGKNLEVFFLDERSFRSSSADYNGDCDNPAGQRQPRPRADGAAEHPQRLLGDRPAARQPGPAGLPRRDQRPGPDDARQRSS